MWHGAGTEEAGMREGGWKVVTGIGARVIDATGVGWKVVDVAGGG